MPRAPTVKRPGYSDAPCFRYSSRMLFSYHTHSDFCDGYVSAGAMAKAAAAAGYSFLGFSSHAPRPLGIPWTMKYGDLDRYVAEIRALDAYWRPRGMAVLLGLETDYVAGIVSPREAAYHSNAPDFLIGSVHFVPGLVDDEFTVDGPKAEFAAGIARLKDKTPLIWKRYYENLIAMMEGGGFDIVGHFDLVKKNNRDNWWFDENSKEYLDAAFAAADRAAELGLVVEINTGGLARGSTASPYPSSAILKHMREAGVRLTIGDDAHSPSHLSAYQRFAIEAAKAAGYRSLWYLDADLVWREIAVEKAGKP